MKTYHCWLLVLALNGCSLLPKPAAVHDFGLPSVNPAQVNKTNATTNAPTVEAPQWLYDNRIRYRLLYTSSTQIGFYTLDKWLAPPPELFAQLLTASNLQSPHPITIRLLEFEQQFISPTQAKVVMAFTVNAISPAKNSIEYSREFRVQLPSPTPDAKGAVLGFSELTKNAAYQIQTWLNTL